MSIERLEDWPPNVRPLLAAGLNRRLRAGPGGKVWEFGETRLDAIANPELSRELRLGITDAIMLVLRDPSDPKRLYEVIGVPPPSDGLGEFFYQEIGSPGTQRFIVRQTSAYTAGSYVIGELAWPGEKSVLDRIVNPLFARPGRERQEIADAMAGLHVLSNMTKHAGGPTAMPDKAAFEEAVNLGLEWLADNPGAEPQQFTVEQFRRRRPTGPSGIKKWMRTKRFGIKQVQREIERRISRPT